MAEKQTPQPKSRTVSGASTQSPSSREHIVKGAHEAGRQAGAEIQREQSGSVDPNTLPPNTNARGD